MTLKNKIWTYFGDFYQKNDSYPNNEGKGIAQRYLEMLAGEVDILIDEISDFVPKLQASKMPEEMLPIYNHSIGTLPTFSEVNKNRKILKFFSTLNKTKGTLQALRIFAKIQGWNNVTLENVLRNYGLDSALTFDSASRKLDSFKQGLDQYILYFWGNLSLNADILQEVYSYILWNQPLDASLSKIIYEDIPATSADLPSYNAMLNNSTFEIQSGKLTQIFS